MASTAARFKQLRNRLQQYLSRTQFESRRDASTAPFTYDLLKILVKEAVWKVPASLQPAACLLLNRVGLVNRSYLAYIHAGRPKHVLTGPFAGMLLRPVPTGGEFFPKLLGTYEMELHGAVARLCNSNFDVVVDVGAAEGYYAVGLARQLPGSRVLCFDGNPHAERLLRLNAQLNGVEHQISIRRWCSLDDLQACLSAGAKPLLVCDCEGGEAELLNPVHAPALRRTTVLVEVHDDRTDGPIGQRIFRSFESTHKIETFFSRDRTLSDLPSVLSLTSQDAEDSMAENRAAPMRWYLMCPVSEESTATPAKDASSQEPAKRGWTTAETKARPTAVPQALVESN